MYKAIGTYFGKGGLSSGNPSASTTFMAPAGENFKIIPQLLTPANALRMNNYLIGADGEIFKRQGLEKIFEVAGTAPVTMLESFTDDIIMFGYGTTVSAYKFSTDAITVVKNDFVTNDPFTGARYGDYFFVGNAGNKLGRVDLALTYTEIAAAPKASVVVAIGARLFANDVDLEGAVRYPAIDDGTNPPFTDWTVGTLADEGGLVSYRAVGPINSIVPLGQYITVFGEKGKFAFYINVIDAAAGISKSDVFQMSRLDFGGARGAIVSAAGLFYANEAGLWQMTALGQQNIPFSDQESRASILLGDKYFDDIDLSDASIVYDPVQENIYLACKNQSQKNNFVVVYNIRMKAFSRITGWNVNRFMSIDKVIYFGSSIATKVYKAFSGYSDDGASIGTEYLQELKLGDFETRQELQSIYIQGYLSTSTTVYVKFDIYDVDGRLITDKLRLEWTTQYNSNSLDGYSGAGYSGSAYGGDADAAGMIESFDGFKPRINNFQRIRIHITNQDKLPHILNWVKLGAKIKKAIRRRKMTQLS